MILKKIRKRARFLFYSSHQIIFRISPWRIYFFFLNLLRLLSVPSSKVILWFMEISFRHFFQCSCTAMIIFMIYKEVSSKAEFLFHYTSEGLLPTRLNVYLSSVGIIFNSFSCSRLLEVLYNYMPPIFFFFLPLAHMFIAWILFILQNYISLSRIAFMARTKIHSILINF